MDFNEEYKSEKINCIPVATSSFFLSIYYKIEQKTPTIYHFIEHLILDSEPLSSYLKQEKITFNGLTVNEWIVLSFRFYSKKQADIVLIKVSETIQNIKQLSQDEIEKITTKSFAFKEELKCKSENLLRQEVQKIKSVLFEGSLLALDTLGNFSHLKQNSVLLFNTISQFSESPTAIFLQGNCKSNRIEFKRNTELIKLNSPLFVTSKKCSAIRLKPEFEPYDLFCFELLFETCFQHTTYNRSDYQLIVNQSIPFIVVENEIHFDADKFLENCNFENAKRSFFQKYKQLMGSRLNESFPMLSALAFRGEMWWNETQYKTYLSYLQDEKDCTFEELVVWFYNYYGLVRKRTKSPAIEIQKIKPAYAKQDHLTVLLPCAFVTEKNYTAFRLLGYYLKHIAKNLSLDITTGIYDEVGNAQSFLPILSLSLNAYEEASFCNTINVLHFLSNFEIKEDVLANLIENLLKKLSHFYHFQQGTFSLKRLLANLSIAEQANELASGYHFFMHLKGLQKTKSLYHIAQLWTMWKKQIENLTPFVYSNAENYFVNDTGHHFSFQHADSFFQNKIEVWQKKDAGFSFSRGISFQQQFPKTAYLIASEFFKEQFVFDIFNQNSALYNGLIGLWRNGNFYMNIEHISSLEEKEVICQKMEDYLHQIKIKENDFLHIKMQLQKKIVKAYHDHASPIVQALNNARGYSQVYFNEELKELEQMPKQTIENLLEAIRTQKMFEVYVGDIHDSMENATFFHYPNWE